MAFIWGQYLRRRLAAELGSASVPLVGRALRSVLVVTSLVLLVASAAAAVRVLPWVFDPDVPVRVALPFARSLLAVAAEAAIVVGWPLGWTMAAFRWSERNEALVLSSLGERPARTLARLAPQAVVFAVALSAAAFAGGRDAREPGRVLDALVEEGRVACGQVTSPQSFGIPFTSVSWVCHPDRAPRVAGRGPGPLSALFFSAQKAQIAPDLRSMLLGDAWLLTGKSRIHAAQFSVRGLPSWFHTSRMPPWGRALVLVAATWLAATVGAGAVLVGRVSGRFFALVVGAAGPVAALGAMRLLEQGNAPPLAWIAVPLASVAAPAALVWAIEPLRGRGLGFIRK